MMVIESLIDDFGEFKAAFWMYVDPDEVSDTREEQLQQLASEGGDYIQEMLATDLAAWLSCAVGVQRGKFIYDAQHPAAQIIQKLNLSLEGRKMLSTVRDLLQEAAKDKELREWLYPFYKIQKEEAEDE